MGAAARKALWEMVSCGGRGGYSLIDDGGGGGWCLGVTQHLTVGPANGASGCGYLDRVGSGQGPYRGEGVLSGQSPCFT